MERKIYTIGYEGATAEQLILTLRNVGVTALADVRELPLSRKKGLSRTPLSLALDEAGIAYHHFKALGDPKAGRDAAKSGDFAKFRRIFGTHILSEPSQIALRALFELAKSETLAMMCFERCASQCHRSIISELAVREGFDVYNLVADRPSQYLANDFKIPRHNSRQSLAAAE